MENNTDSNNKELIVYRALAEFSQNAWKSWTNSKLFSEKILNAVDELLEENFEPPDALVSHIIMTIDTVLYQDCKDSRSSQRRNRVSTSDGYLKEFDAALHSLYQVLKRLNFEKIYDQIDGSLFCRHWLCIFIFPGYPSEKKRAKGWNFTHRKFVIPTGDNQSVKKIPFDKVQHVVHDVKDLFKILYLIDLKSKTHVGTKLCLEGRPNIDYNGPDLIWFSPVPPSNFGKGEVCPSLNPDNSRYGCFRLTVPFSIIEEMYPATYCLGTRKYNYEHCHSYLLTEAEKIVTYIEPVDPVKIESMSIVKKETSGQFYWLSYRSDPHGQWDMVDFAVSASKLELDIQTSQIRLDFIEHSFPCIPTLNTNSWCRSPITKIDAMKLFLAELKMIDIGISNLKHIFDDCVYNDLIQHAQQETE